jgi:4-amino-4-deoxy-L-arabinose transferase-like glycosyltransferase
MRQSQSVQATYIIAASAIIHLLVASRVGLGSDEAHYALYGLHLDWSYFDHPPLIGWIQAVALVFSESEFSLRVFPILISAATSFALYHLVQLLFPLENRRLPLISVALYNLGITFQIMGLSMLPEDPLLLMALLSLIFFIRALEHGRMLDWLGVGFFLGLAGLSKYTAVTLPVTIILFLAWQKRLSVFTQPGIWLAAVTAAIVITPVFYWNMNHDWASFIYQLDHGFKDRPWSFKLFAQSQAAQFLVYTPGLYVASIAAIIAAWYERNHPGVQLLLLLALPVFILFGWGSGFEATLLHWTALAWLGCTPLAARWIVFHWPKTWVKILVWSIPVVSLPILLILYSELFHQWMPVEENKHPFRQLFGWQQAATRAVEIRDKLNENISVSQRPAKLFVSNWSIASRLAWYARPNGVLVTDRRSSQFSLWYGKAETGDWGVLVMPIHLRMPEMKGKQEQFENCREQERLKYVANNRVLTTFIFYICKNYHA